MRILNQKVLNESIILYQPKGIRKRAQLVSSLEVRIFMPAKISTPAVL